MAAPYLASPARRLAAAAVDLAVILLLWIIAAAIIQAIRIDLLTIGVAAVLVFILYQACFLHYWSGQTPGRRVLSIRVVSSRPAIELTLGQCIARPLLRLLWWVAFFPAEYALEIPWLSFLPPFIDLALLTCLPSRRTVSDLLCRTVVVKTPRPEPHRAPAGPMYSATDAEFGVPARPVRRVRLACVQGSG